MSQVTIMKRPQLFAAATAITAVGFLTAAPPAQAAPEPCTQYGFNGNFVMRGADGWEVTVDAATGSAAVGNAVAIFDDGGAVRGFVRAGGIQGRNVDFTVSWINQPEDSVWTFTGTVSDDGLVHNGGPSSWESTSPLACMDVDPATKPLPGSIITAPGPETLRPLPPSLRLLPLRQ